MKSRLLGLGLGLTMATLGVAAVPAAAAFADTAPSTCYTGCTTAITSPPVTTATVTPVTTPVTEPAPIAQTQAGSTLPFTGADIEEMAAVGAGALMVGGLMVRRSRRVRRVTA